MWMTPGSRGKIMQAVPLGHGGGRDGLRLRFDKPSGTWKRWVDLKEDVPIGEDEAILIIVPRWTPSGTPS